MRTQWFFPVGFLLIFFACAPYKQLKPDPELLPREQGYIELKKGKNDFELKKDNQYFIEFPSPPEKNFFLVLTYPAKKSLETSLTTKLEKKTSPGKPVEEAESPAPDSMSVYPVSPEDSVYYWLINRVKEDVVLSMQYRYVPQWRFRFENKHAEFKETLATNKVDRSVYKSIGETFHFNGFNFQVTIDTITNHLGALKKVHEQLLSIESIFPRSILNSEDEAYQNYLTLKSGLEEEMAFQDNYLAVLAFFQDESNNRGNTVALLESVGDYIEYFSRRENLPENVVSESQLILKNRLREVVPHYEQKMRGKQTADPLDPEKDHYTAFMAVDSLYEAAGIEPPRDYKDLARFVKAFQTKSTSLNDIRREMIEDYKSIQAMETPQDDYFTSLKQRTRALTDSIPTPIGDAYAPYSSYACAVDLNDRIAKLMARGEKLSREYAEAASVLPQINALARRADFKGMLGVLSQYRHIDFLMEKYQRLDSMSIEQQSSRIRDDLLSRSWASAEQGLFALHNDRTFIHPEKIMPRKTMVVRDLEDSLYLMVDRVTRSRVDAFLEENVGTLENIDSLYESEVFLPVHDITFSSGSKNELIQRKDDLVAHLAKLKENEFPKKAIKLMFDEFLKNPQDNGVARARAIVAHGDHYKGEDEKTERIVAEVDPNTAKWIVTAKNYRRVFALPVTDRKNGTNRYFVRFRIKVPTEAKFPVYDVNIKLSKAIAGNAGTNQWFESITINGEPIKNEGRYTITAPTAGNDYECQITPVRMRADKSNQLDIAFDHPSFGVHPLSVMVQKPIIKKN